MTEVSDDVSSLSGASLPGLTAIDPSALRVTDIYSTKGCPLARVMRTELRKRGVRSLKVVYSEELSQRPDPALYEVLMAAEGGVRRSIPGSTAFVPPAAGLLLASTVVHDLLSSIESGK